MNIPIETIRQGLALLPAKMSGCRAMTMLIAIGLQESGFLVRRQYGNGPARGFWQFEQNGGVKGVMEYPATTSYAAAICLQRGVPFERAKVWAALETDDVLAVVFARLLLWSDPKSCQPSLSPMLHGSCICALGVQESRIRTSGLSAMPMRSGRWRDACAMEGPDAGRRRIDPGSSPVRRRVRLRLVLAGEQLHPAACRPVLQLPSRLAQNRQCWCRSEPQDSRAAASRRGTCRGE